MPAELIGIPGSKRPGKGFSGLPILRNDYEVRIRCVCKKTAFWNQAPVRGEVHPVVGNLNPVCWGKSDQSLNEALRSLRGPLERFNSKRT